MSVILKVPPAEQPGSRWAWVAAARGARQVTLLLVTLSLFVDLLTYDMVVPFLPDYIRRWNASEIALGVLFGAYPIGLLLGLPLAGRCCDRIGQRVPVLAGMVGLACSCLLYATAHSYAVLFSARLLQGFAGALSWTGCLSLLAQAYPASSRGQAMGTAMMGMSLGTLLGPPLGGVLFEWGGFQLPFLAAGVCAVVLVLVLAVLLPQSSRCNHRANWQPAAFLDRRFLATAGAIVVGSTLLSLLEPILPLHLKDRLQAGPAAIGLLFGLATLAYGISSPLAGAISDRWGRRRTMTVGLGASAIALPLAGLPETWWGEACALMPLGVACALLLSPTLPDLADAADRRGGDGYGAAYALSNMAYAIGMLLGPLLGGALMQVLGVPGTFWAVGLATLLYLPVLRQMDHRKEATSKETESLAA